MLEIISCSRRTDIPAFYYDWLQEALKNKYASVKNPYNQSIYMIDLSPEKVHSICLWSKSYKNVLKDQGLLSLYNLHFQFTIPAWMQVLLKGHTISFGENLKGLYISIFRNYCPGDN